ncbi:MAG: hypothetical protein JNK82_08925 [Myxococcaceae bacterium]|nr:hypothetical protein [Myxococcaceae bacterium]
MADAFDSNRPDAVPLDAVAAKKLPLHAFALLESGDAFDITGGTPPRDGRAKAEAYFDAKVKVLAHGAAPGLVKVVRDEAVGQLLGNVQLVARMSAARPIEIDLVPPNKRMSAYGYPKGASANAAGLFWDHPSWPCARIALLQTALANERALVIHELAHAIARLAFTKDEQDLIYRLMLPTYRYRSWVDEVFAIYSEREFLPSFTEREGHAPGVYGMARQRWDERHVFTRFVRRLYHPHKPLAGSTAAIPRNLLG